MDPQKEHRRQKVKKYEEKLREEEKVGEDIKNKWQAFNNKVTNYMLNQCHMCHSKCIWVD